MEIEITYGDKEISIDNFNKDERPKYFNYNTYEYIAKKCWKPKRKREIKVYKRNQTVKKLTINKKALLEI